MVNPQDKITLTQSYTSAPEEFKLKFLQFLNKIYRENRIPNEWRNAVVTKYLRKVTEGNPKTTKELVFLTSAIRYTLKFLI